MSLEQAQHSARLAALAVMASLEDAVGDLERIDAWLSVTGFVQAQPGYAQTPAVLNSSSEVVLDVFGATAGAHARTAIGVAVEIPASTKSTPSPLPSRVLSWGQDGACEGQADHPIVEP